jgi:hypothetical protein
MKDRRKRRVEVRPDAACYKIKHQKSKKIEESRENYNAVRTRSTGIAAHINSATDIRWY